MELKSHNNLHSYRYLHKTWIQFGFIFWLKCQQKHFLCYFSILCVIKPINSGAQFDTFSALSTTFQVSIVATLALFHWPIFYQSPIPWVDVHNLHVFFKEAVCFLWFFRLRCFYFCRKKRLNWFLCPYNFMKDNFSLNRKCVLLLNSQKLGSSWS